MFQRNVPRRIQSETMRFSTLCEVIASTHLSYYVQSPFENRGGLMLVAPPGHLKTTAAEILSEFPRTLIISNLTVKSLNGMRDEFLGGNIRTLVFSDYANIYRRHGSVSANIESVIMGLVGEGFRKPAFSDQRVAALPARAAVVGCMTPKFSEQMEENWLDSGFYRRFIWCRYILEDSEYLDRAILEWRKAELDGDFVARIPNNLSIPYRVTSQESDRVEHTMRHTVHDKKQSYILALKVLSVLKWKFGKRDESLPIRIWNDFAESLTPGGARISVKEKNGSKVL